MIKKIETNEINVNNLLRALPNGFEIMRKIAHMNLYDQYLIYKYLIGQLILDKNIWLFIVINKVGKIDNVNRIYNMEIIVGEKNYNIEYKEVGVRFQFDLWKTNWYSRLQNELEREIQLYKKMRFFEMHFAYVGHFIILSCKKKVKNYMKNLNQDAYTKLK